MQTKCDKFRCVFSLLLLLRFVNMRRVVDHFFLVVLVVLFEMNPYAICASNCRIQISYLKRHTVSGPWRRCAKCMFRRPLSRRWIRVLRRATSPACVQIGGRCTVQYTRQTHQKIQMTDKCTSHIAAEHTHTHTRNYAQFLFSFSSGDSKFIRFGVRIIHTHTSHIHTHEISISRYFNRRRVSLRLFFSFFLFDCIMLSVYFRFAFVSFSSTTFRDASVGCCHGMIIA